MTEEQYKELNDMIEKFICNHDIFLTNAYGKPELYHEGDNPSVGT